MSKSLTKNCIFGEKKNGSCKRKVGRKSSRSIKRAKNQRSLRRMAKPRPKSKSPCLFGVKKNGSCSRKRGRRSCKAKFRSLKRRLGRLPKRSPNGCMNHLPVTRRSEMSSRQRAEKLMSDNVSCPDGHVRNSDGNCIPIGVVESKGNIVAIVMPEGDIKSVPPIPLKETPPTVPVVKIDSLPSFMREEIKQSSAEGKPSGDIVPASKGNVAALIKIFDHEMANCAKNGGHWDADGRKCIMPVKSEIPIEQLVLSPNKKEVVAIVKEGEVQKLSHPISAPILVPEEAQAHPSKDDLKNAPVIATPPIEDVIVAARNCESKECETIEQLKAKCNKALDDWDEETSQCYKLSNELKRNRRDCRESTGTWDVKTRTCIPAAVILSADKQDVIAVVDQNGEIEVLNKPVPTPPDLSPEVIIIPPPDIMEDIEAVAESGIPSAEIDIITPPSDLLNAISRQDCKPTEKWENNKCASLKPECEERGFGYMWSDDTGCNPTEEHSNCLERKMEWNFKEGKCVQPSDGSFAPPPPPSMVGGDHVRPQVFRDDVFAEIRRGKKLRKSHERSQKPKPISPLEAAIESRRHAIGGFNEGDEVNEEWN